MYKIIASGFGSGYSRFAPGTAGSVVGILLFYGLHFSLHQANFEVTTISTISVILIIIVLFIGVQAIKKVHQIWEHDASKIVIDEIVGVWIAALFIPFEWTYYLYAFIIFRFFDILKPLWIKKIDDLSGDWSVMLDDVLAGIYSLIAMQVLLYWVNP